MTALLDYLFGAATFMPHGVCLLWRPDLVALHAISDLVITVSYLAIPLIILTFMRRRADLDSDAARVGYLFSAFIIACALTHFAALVTLWIPAYGAQGLIKAATAIVSAVTAVVIWRMLPDLLAIPSPAQLREANTALEAANAALTAANHELEDKVAERTRRLHEANQRFERALTGSNISVLAMDPEGKLVWAHSPETAFGVDDQTGQSDADMLMANDGDPGLQVLNIQARETGEPSTGTLTVSTLDNSQRFLDITVSPTYDGYGKINGTIATAVDITEQKLFEARLTAMAANLAETTRRFEVAIEGSPISVFEQDSDLRYTFLANPPKGTVSEDFLGRTDPELFQPAEADVLVPAKRSVIETGEPDRLEVHVSINDVDRYYDLKLEPTRTSDGKATGLIGTAVDITDRRKNEKQMRLVMRELTHRSKNLLAVVQAMARQTASRSDDLESFVASFSARLQAMAASHDLLVSHSWYGAEIEELVRAHLAQTVDPTSSQVRLAGAQLRVTADAAQNLGLALHELTTNAAKYGALSVDDGYVDVRWSREGEEVALIWQEFDGPRVAEPQRKGFGRMLLERSVGASLNGSVTLTFEPEGLKCIIRFPSENLIAT